MTTIHSAVQRDSAHLDQRWAAAREWLWSLGADQATFVDELLRKQSAGDFARALAASQPTVETIRYLAALAFDAIANNCLDEQISIEADPGEDV